MKKRRLNNVESDDEKPISLLLKKDVSEEETSSDSSFVEEDDLVSSLEDDKSEEILTDEEDENYQGDTIKRIADRLSEKLFEEPSWREGLEEKDVERLEPDVTAILEEIEAEKPNMKKIMDSKISRKDKKHCIRLFTIYLSLDPADRDELGERINHCLNKEKQFEEYEEEEKDLRKIILGLETTEDVKRIIYSRYLHFKELSRGSDFYHSEKDWLNWATSLPYNKTVPFFNVPENATNLQINKYCLEVRRRLDSRLYGMDDVKRKIIIMLLKRIIKKDAKGLSLAIKSRPGYGKTELAKTLAWAVELPFEKIACGGTIDATIFKGSDNVWLGSSPSIMLRILRRMKCCNGVVLFDEVDKVSLSKNGVEVENSLLEITDYTQNNNFRDAFISEYSHNLSLLWLLFTINSEQSMNPMLRDRLDIVELPVYTFKDKIVICQEYVLPRECENIGLSRKHITITEEASRKIVFTYGEQEGIRGIDKEVRNLVSKISGYSLVCLPEGTTAVDLGFKLGCKITFPFEITLDVLDRIRDAVNKETVSYCS